MASIPIEKDSGTQQSLLAQGLVTLTGGVVLFAAFLLMAVIGYQVTYSGKIFPGVSINGIDLSGKTPEQAQEILNQQLSYPLAGRIVFQDHNDIWSVTPAEIGYGIIDSCGKFYSKSRVGPHSYKNVEEDRICCPAG